MSRTDRKQQAAARREQRQRARERERSQAPPLTVSRLKRPGERPAHQASTAHVQSAYPAVAEAGLGAAGVYVGKDHHGGSFVYDPWVLYARGALTNANTIVLGQPGYGKSALTKSYVWRQRVFGRVGEFIDPKGEYAPLVQAMGGVVLRLQPGGRVKLNPLTRVGTREMREGLLEAVTRAMLARPLSQAEAVGLGACLAAADTHRDGGETCIPDVIDQLASPSLATAELLGMSTREATDRLRECRLALLRLKEGPLRGMFDAPTSEGERAWEAPAVCLDLSAVGAGAQGADLALGITMVCASAFLDAKRGARARAAVATGRSAVKVIRANDEAWRALPVAGLGEYYQAAFKLSRETGVQHWMVLHRLSDLRAAGDEGSRQQRLAEGLLADTSTVVVYHQAAREIHTTTELLGLSNTEANLIGGLAKGSALWRVGGRSFHVSHVLSEIETGLIETDEAMLDRHPQTAGLMLEPETATAGAVAVAAGGAR